MEKVNEYIRERDLIVNEIGEFSDDDFEKSGISIEEYNHPTAETISKLVDYIAKEYNQTSIYSE